VTQLAESQPFFSAVSVVPSQSECAQLFCGGAAQQFEATHV
jgi:hypothetical protein